MTDGVECRSFRIPKKSAKPSQSEYIDYFWWRIALFFLTCSEDVSTVDVPTCIKDVESIRSSLRGCAFFRDAIEELRSVLLTSYRFLLEASISVDSCVRNRVYSCKRRLTVSICICP